MTKKWWVIGGTVTVLLVVGVAVAAVIVVRSPWLLVDEWTCSKGESPAVKADGSLMCFSRDAELPAGWGWHPLGNRPLNCSNRPGWTEIARPDAEFGGIEKDCLKKGIEMPNGWSKA